MVGPPAPSPPSPSRASTPLTAGDAARRTLEARERGEVSVVALVLDGSAMGRRMIFLSAPEDEFRQLGSLEDRALEEAVEEEARRLLGSHEPAPGPDAGTRDLTVRRGPGEDASIPVYFEVTRPPSGLLIVGAGHLAGPLHELGALLGFRVTVADDRPAFARAERFPRAWAVKRVDFTDPFQEIPPGDRTHVLLVTRGHRYDYECLRLLLRENPLPVYLGMIGSRRRVRATFHQLLEEGIPRERLDRIRAPIGLDVGAETPAEIAVAVAAEWVQLRRGGSGRPLTEVERVAERFFGEREAGGADE
jgi:xanthine dehydrogenase accessory factor